MMHRKWLPLFVLVVSSLLGDLLTNSQASSVDRERQLQFATEVIRNLPETAGPWRASPAEALSENVLRSLQCRAHASLWFVNIETGERVSLILMAGAAGPMVVHGPELFYENGSFDLVETARTENISSADGRTDTFERVAFRSKSGGQPPRRIYHAWRKSQGGWEAPRNPRLALGGEAMLYKLQVSTSVVAETADGSAGSDACRRLLEVLLPVLDRALEY